VPTTPGATRYLVLAGSFREAANAEAHRAKLALAGVEARIESVTTQDRVTLHRVRIGPANSLEQAQGVAARLKSQGFDSRVVKMP
ncbi:MAG: SPOR domain-containing protein, partial [Panacagrimonas sp.]